MKEARRMSAGRGPESSVAQRTRLVISHCPGCGDPVAGRAYMIGELISEDLTRKVQYQLCRPCVQRLLKASKRRREALTDAIEANLRAWGAFVGIEREGLRA